jgi:hypothetical protein
LPQSEVQESHKAAAQVISDRNKGVVGNGGAPGMNCDLRMYWDSDYTVIVVSNFSPPIAQQISRYIEERIQQ